MYNTYLIKFQRWQGSVATIMEDKNSNMYGIVWELQKEHLKTLDEQEGVPHNVYKRINVQVNNTYIFCDFFFYNNRKMKWKTTNFLGSACWIKWNYRLRFLSTFTGKISSHRFKSKTKFCIQRCDNSRGHGK